MKPNVSGRHVYPLLWPLALFAGAVATAGGLGGCDRSSDPGGSGAPATTPTATSRVEIDGGVDESRHNYQWTVINHYTSPIVSVAFPHYHADMFFPPQGWTSDGSTFLVNVGVPDKPGVCIAEPESRDSAIPPGGRRDFRMRIAASGALVGEGTVRIRFEDHSTADVTGVTLPVPPPYSFKMLPLVGAAIIFIAWVAVRTIRERRRSSVKQAAGPQNPDEEHDVAR